MKRVSLIVAILLVSGCVELEKEPPLRERGIAYLVSVQNEDGGFAAAGEGPSDFATSAWVALALASGSPEDSAIPALRDYLSAQAQAVKDNSTGSLSRVNPVSLFVLAGLAIDVPGTPDHIVRLKGFVENTSLSWNEQLFLLGALGRAGEEDAAKPVFDRVWAKLLDPTDPDLTNDAWMRSNAVLSLLANNVSSNDKDIRAAARSVLPFQKDDKGFRGQLEFEPDASTTAVVVAVLTQVPFVYSSERLAGLEFLASLQQADGSVRFSEEFDFSPVKTTSEAVLAATGDGPFRA